MATPTKSGPVSFDEAQAMIQEDSALAEAVRRVGRLDFSMLKAKLMEDGFLWTPEYVDEVEALYRKFLALNARHPGRKICPTAPIDAFWHAHITDTHAYVADCDAVFGEYLHHFPYFGMRGAQDRADLNRTFKESVKLFTSSFGVDPTLGDTTGRTCATQRCP